MPNEQIKQVLLAHGFKEKEQPDGSFDLNPYVYTAVRAVLAQALAQQRVSVKDRLPENGTECLVWKEPRTIGFGHSGFVLSIFEDGKFSDIYGYEEVTHWIPIRKPVIE